MLDFLLWLLAMLVVFWPVWAFYLDGLPERKLEAERRQRAIERQEKERQERYKRKEQREKEEKEDRAQKREEEREEREERRILEELDELNQILKKDLINRNDAEIEKNLGIKLGSKLDPTDFLANPTQEPKDRSKLRGNKKD